MINFAEALKEKRRSKYAIPDIHEFAQMLKSGYVQGIPDDLAPTLIKFGPQDDDTFSLWVKCCLEDQGLTCKFVREPNTHQLDVQGTCSHMDFMCDAFFERTGDCIVLGNRGSAKTLGFAAMLFIEALYKPGIELAHLGAIKTQADKCYDYFKKMVTHELFADKLAQRPLASKTVFKNGSKVEILIGSMTGVNSPHPQVAGIDEVELMEWKVLQEAFNMARSKSGYTASTRLTSTRKFSTGSMQRLIDEAKTRGLKLYQWNIWDTIETCVMDVSSEDANVLVPFEYVDLITRKDVVISVPAPCLACSLVSSCKGQAKFSNAGSGVVTMGDTMKNYATLDEETWIAQIVCQQPGRSDLIYPMFEDGVHVIDYKAMLQKKYGEEYVYNYDANLLVYAGQDAGFGCPATVYGQVIVDEEGGDPYLVIFDENYDKDIAPSVFIRESLRPKHEEYNVDTYFIDPSGQALTAELEIEGFYIQDAENDVEYGLDIVKALFATRRLLIDQSCKSLIWELKRYKRMPSGKPLKKDDHLMDATRYMCCEVGVYESVMSDVYA